MELAILRTLLPNVAGPMGDQFHPRPGAVKTLYLGPIRALVQERVRGWGERFGKLGVVCKELSGDTEARDPHDLDCADIICATPECFGKALLWAP